MIAVTLLLEELMQEAPTEVFDVNRNRTHSLLLLTAACWLLGCSSVDKWAIVVEKSLGKPPPDWRVTVSPDNRHIAYWGPSQGAKSVFLDGIPGRKYSGAAARGIGGFASAVELVETISGELLRCGFLPLIGDPVFSPDSQSLAYRAKTKNGREVVVRDGREIAESDGFGLRERVDTDPSFSLDGRRFAYVVRRGDDVACYVDDPEIVSAPPRVALWAVSSPEGERMAYGFLRGDEFVLNLGGRVEARKHALREDLLSATWIAFSPDGKRLAYSNQSRAVILDGLPGPAFDRVEFAVFSRDSRRFAYAAQEGSSIFVVVDGRKYGPYESDLDFPPGLTFSPDSKRAAWSCIVDEQQSVYLDGKLVSRGATRYPPTEVQFSPDGRRFSFFEDDNQVVIDDTGERRVFAGRTLVFSPDSRRTATLSSSESRQAVAVDGVLGKPYSSVSGIAFSRDSRHVAYWGQSQDGWRIVVDGMEVGEFDRPVASSRLVFDQAGRLRGMGIRELEVFYFELANR